MDPPLPINVGPIYGAILISSFVGFALWGIACMQTFFYYFNYPGDGFILKLMVAFVLLIDTAHEIVISKGLWSALIQNFGNPSVKFQWFPDFLFEILLTGVVAFTAQLFFTFRIWIFSGKKLILPTLLIILSLAQLGGITAYVTLTLRSLTIPTLHRYDRVTSFINGTSAVQDTIMAVVMCWILWTRRTGFERSNQIITRLIFIAIPTGLFTAILGRLTIVALVAWPTTEIFVGIYGPLCGLYCNLLLANLNARAYVRSRDNPPTLHANSHPLSRLRATLVKPHDASRDRPLTIHVETSKTTDQEFHDLEGSLEGESDQLPFTKTGARSSQISA